MFQYPKHFLLAHSIHSTFYSSLRIQSHIPIPTFIYQSLRAYTFSISHNTPLPSQHQLYQQDVYHIPSHLQVQGGQGGQGRGGSKRSSRAEAATWTPADADFRGSCRGAEFWIPRRGRGIRLKVWRLFELDMETMGRY